MLLTASKMEGLRRLIVLSFFSALLAVIDASTSDQLPSFTSVKVKAGGGSTVVTVTYDAPQVPSIQWLVGGFPVPVSHHDYHVITDHVSKYSILSTTAAGQEGVSVSVCLQLRTGETCMTLNPQSGNVEQRESVDFPWPDMRSVTSRGSGINVGELFIFDGESSTIPYTSGSKTGIYVPDLNPSSDKPYDLKYSAAFLGHTKDSQGASVVVKATSRDMKGGALGDLISVAPQPFGGQGWEVRVNTEEKELEGVVLVNTEFLPTQGLISSVVNTRPININMAHHWGGPFSQGYLAKLPQADYIMPWSCRDGYECLVICPFVSNGDVTVSISTVVNYEPKELPAVTSSAKVTWLGEYLGEAKFVIPNFRRSSFHGGIFRCDVKNSQNEVFMAVKV